MEVSNLSCLSFCGDISKGRKKCLYMECVTDLDNSLANGEGVCEIHAD